MKRGVALISGNCVLRETSYGMDDMDTSSKTSDLNCCVVITLSGSCSGEAAAADSSSEEP